MDPHDSRLPRCPRGVRPDQHDRNERAGGRSFPLYLLGAKLVEAFPLVPLLENTGLGIALFSYDGKLCWGFNGDYELMPDLRTFVRAIETSFATLAEATGGPAPLALSPYSVRRSLRQKRA